MRIINTTATIVLALSITFNAFAGDGKKGLQAWPKADVKALKEWQNMRFGMFIHWGPVSLKGTEIGWSRGKEVPVKEYDNLYKQFNPEKFDADEWVSIAKAAGMKYLVLTTKHHDGFCLWDTKTSPYNIMSTPFKRDIVRELSAACKKQNIMFGAYYSILDWYHPDYNTSSRGGPGYQLPEGQKADLNRYEKYMKDQLRELLTNYGSLGVLWFDGEWEKPWTHDRGVALYNWLRDLQPDLLINNRVDKGRKGMHGGTKDRSTYKGDFDTPEQRVGEFQTEWPWESCITMCKQWAWKANDKMKSLRECIHTLVHTAGGDGNLLLNVGPMPDGRIEPRQVERLQEIGRWLKTNGKTIYGTRGGPFKPAKWGVSTHDGKFIYLHVLTWPCKKLSLPALPQKIVGAKLMDGHNLSITQSKDTIELVLSESDKKPIDTIIVLELDKPYKLQNTPMPNRLGGSGS
jgi:alpha-L-fucosidase